MAKVLFYWVVTENGEPYWWTIRRKRKECISDFMEVWDPSKITWKKGRKLYNWKCSCVRIEATLMTGYKD